MSPDGQKALLGGGITAWGSEHFPMKRGPRDYSIVPLPDMFELDLQTMCWVQACLLSHPPSVLSCKAKHTHSSTSCSAWQHAWHQSCGKM